MKLKRAEQAIFFYQGDKLVAEQNPTFLLQRWLYQTLTGRLLRLLFRTRAAAQLGGWYHSTRRSKKLIAPFIKLHAIGMDAFIEPADGYASFNAFFMRALKPSARQLPDSPNTVVSPADGKLLVISNVTPSTRFFVKELPFDLLHFVGQQHAARFANGTLCMFRLAPYDYHRFHAPLAGTITHLERIKGTLESVNPIVFMTGHQPLTSNERLLLLLETEAHGTVAMVAVGAMFVGSILLSCKLGDTVRQGQELGMFAFGGSTVVLLFGHGMVSIKEPFLTHSLQGYETAVTMGTTIST